MIKLTILWHGESFWNREIVFRDGRMSIFPAMAGSKLEKPAGGSSLKTTSSISPTLGYEMDKELWPIKHYYLGNSGSVAQATKMVTNPR